MNEPKIIITISEGMVHSVYSNTPALKVLVKDYDVNSADPSETETDASGDSFFLTREIAHFEPDEVNQFFEEYKDA